MFGVEKQLLICDINLIIKLRQLNFDKNYFENKKKFSLWSFKVMTCTI